MKIEKINDNQIKCTLNKSDLQSREIKISELAYGTEKAKDLFRDMMQQASYEFGFEAEDIPLMIEAIPVSPDCIVLLITKVEDPEELDTRFSKFAPAKDESEDSEQEDDLDDNSVLGLLNDMNHFFSKVKETVAEKSSGTVSAVTGEYDIPKEQIIRCYAFDNINLVLTACHLASGLFQGESSLYKAGKDKYYLLFSSSQKSNELVRFCNILSEYAIKIKINSSSENFFTEHYQCIIPDQAIEKLGRI